MAILSMNEILAAKVQSQLAGSDFVLIKAITDLSSDAKVGMDRVSIPRVSGLALEDIVPGTAPSASSFTTAGDVLLLDQPKQVATFLPYTDNLNSAVDMQAQFFIGAPRIYAQGIEALIASKLETAGPNDFASTAAAVAGNVAFNIKDIALAKKKLDVQKVSKTGRYLGVNANTMEILASTQEFQDGSKAVSNEALMKGVVSIVKGFQVIQSEDLSDNKVTGWHPEAIAFANHAEMNQEVEVQKSLSRTFVALKGKYGCTILDSGKRKVTITCTAALP